MSYSNYGSVARTGNPVLENPQLRPSNKSAMDAIGEATIPDYFAGYSRKPNMFVERNYFPPKTDYSDREENPNTKNVDLVGGNFFKDFKRGFMSVINPVAKVATKLAPLAPLLI